MALPTAVGNAEPFEPAQGTDLMARLIEAPLAAPCTVQWKPQVPAVEKVCR